MNTELEKIMQDYKNGATLEETNAALKPYGIFLDPDKNPGGGWTEAEMTEGFIPGEPVKRVPVLADYQKRIPALAGHTIIVKVKEGTYEVRYNADGYHDGSKKL